MKLGASKGTFFQKDKSNVKPYQVLLKNLVYALKEFFKKELERRRELQILTALEVNEMPEWCDSFLIVLKHNSTVHLCLDPARLNKAPIRPMNRGPTLNDISPD